METRAVDRVESWQARPISGGFGGLRELADESFSGAVECDTAWLYMLNGRVIGVFDGPLDAFADGPATAHEAPDPALPLLFSMREQGGTPRGRYYTENTGLAEVDETLTAGGFTGYVELSENVLSGDYYVVYYGGRSMSAAFVGASEQLVTGDEAFERAADEVGIYEVVEVDVAVTELPEPAPEPESEPEPAPREEPEPAPRTESEPAERPEPERASGSDTAPDPERAGGSGSSGATPTDRRTDPTGGDSSETGDPAPAPDEAEGDRPADAGAAVDEAESEPAESPGSAGAETRPDPPAAADDPADGRVVECGSVGDRRGADRPGADRSSIADARGGNGPGSDPDDGPVEPDGPGDAPAGASPDGSGVAVSGEEVRTDEDVFSEEAQWRESRSIPALDPEESGPLPERTGDSAERSEPGPESGDGRTSEQTAAPDVTELRQAVEDREERLHRFRERLDEVESERDDLLAERDDLRDELEEARAELAAAREELETARNRLDEVQRAGAGADPGSAGDTGLSATEALAGTNLFVRYGSKGEPTLAAARDDGATREAVDANLRIEHHTSFEASETAVEGEPFESFLAESLEYRFAAWVVRDLLYEIRDSGHRAGLGDLYGIIPEIDRAQLHGTVTVQSDDEDGEPGERTFDVVLRDKMGRPLVVCDLSTGRSPVAAGAMGSLIDDGTAVAAGSETLAAAFYVTSSFFRPDALESATEATGGSFLSRDKRESFVRVGRKQGYHLCLVEARDGTFHVSIPEL